MLKSPRFFKSAISSVLLVSLSTLAACSKQTTITSLQNPAVQAPAQVNASLSGVSARSSASGSDVSVANETYLSIKKASLEKEFLLHGNLIAQAGIPTSHGMQSRIVAFKRVQEKVYLLEASQGHVVTKDLPSRLILASFPIQNETDDALVIDFNAGMTQAFTASDWHGSDSGDKPATTIETTAVKESYIDSIRTVGNELEIRQVAQLDTSSADGSSVAGYELRYYLSPYRPSEKFVSRETSDFTRVGFFEAAPLVEDSTARPVTHIAHWDDSKPVTYAVSANTPPEYAQAIKEGILYWNKAFGREVVRVESAPADAIAPDPRYNLVQWVPNDATGSAYADAVLDPRTGETRHAQVFINSGLALGNKSSVPLVIRRLRQSTPPSTPKLALSFLHMNDLCDFDPSAELAQEVQLMVANGADDDAIARASRDYVRYVAAHEVGHTLGLRHNFAGSLASTVNMTQRNELFRRYLENGEIPSKDMFTSSVMEYATMFDSVMTGAQLLSRAEPLPYDRLAIRWGYAGEKIDPKTAPLFCTDSHAQTYKDCVRFDNGADPIVANSLKIDTAISVMPMMLVEKYLMTKTAPDARDRKPLESVAVDPKEYAGQITDALKDQLSWFAAEGVSSIAIERQFLFDTAFNQSDVLKTQQDWVRKQLDSLGGVDTVIFSLLPTESRPAAAIAERARKGLEAALASPNFRQGLGYDGKPYQLSDDEAALIQSVGNKLFDQVESTVTGTALDLLGASKFTVANAGFEIEAKLASVAKTIVLAQTDETIPGPAGAEASKIQKFRYPLKLRAKAAKLLAKSLGDAIDWSESGRDELFGSLKSIADKSLGVDVTKADPSKLTRAQRQWVEEQIALLGLIEATEKL